MKIITTPNNITIIDIYKGNSILTSNNEPATNGPTKLPILVNVELSPPAKPCRLPAIFE